MPYAAMTAPITYDGRVVAHVVLPVVLQIVLVVALRFRRGSFHAIKTKAIEIVSSLYYSAFHDALVFLATLHAGTRGRPIRETIQFEENILDTLPWPHRIKRPGFGVTQCFDIARQRFLVTAALCIQQLVSRLPYRCVQDLAQSSLDNIENPCIILDLKQYPDSRITHQ